MDSAIGIFLVNFQKCSEQLYDGKLRTAASDFMYVKPQLQVIFVVWESLLRYLLKSAKVKSCIFLHGD